MPAAALKKSSSQVHGASLSILEDGYALIRADVGMVEALDQVFDSADRFFARRPEEKKRYERPDILEGYRDVGAERSGPFERPDLNESFSLVLRNMARNDIVSWAGTNPLHRALRAAAPRYAALVDSILEGLRYMLNPHGDRVSSAAFSYLQLNYYRPQQEQRDFLQDIHEDGHLLTVVTSRQPGLEAEIDGRFEAINFDPDELLVMPGSILTLMTGGRIRPLPHRVRNVEGVAKRASLMYFGNASVKHPPRAWIAAPDGSLPDIGVANAEASKLFGLPSIETIAR
jgi:isopenicillin N synthase-like dioxygenase